MTGRQPFRDLEEDLADLEAGAGAGVREVGLIPVLSTLSNGGSLEEIDADRRLYQLDGERVRFHGSLDDVLASVGRGSS